MPRSWFYQQMVNSAPLTTLMEGGIHSSTALKVAPQVKPFILYRTIAHRPGQRGDDGDINREEVFLVFVHDMPGDYLRINQGLELLKTVFVNLKDEAAGVARCDWLEDSEDFRDEEMGTILRYARIQVRYLT